MVRLQLPVIYCPDCTSQLGGTAVYLVDDNADTLVCGFCAAERIGAGQALRPLFGPGPISRAGDGFDIPGEGTPVDQAEAAALLIRLGANVTDAGGAYVDPHTGGPADLADVRAALVDELEGRARA